MDEKVNEKKQETRLRARGSINGGKAGSAGKAGMPALCVLPGTIDRRSAFRDTARCGDGVLEEIIESGAGFDRLFSWASSKVEGLDTRGLHIGQPSSAK
jgi:hypothetical protein